MSSLRDFERVFRETRAVCSKEMILSGPEVLEGQKIREAQHKFSTLVHAMLRERCIYFTAMVNAGRGLEGYEINKLKFRIE